MSYIDLAWQVPAIFTAVPMLARMLPVKLPTRAIPLFYFVVSLVVMALPGSTCLALGAAGLVSMIHVRLGENLTATDPPDMRDVANKLALVWDYAVTHLPALPVRSGQDASIHELLEDDNTEHDEESYPEPPRPPGKPVSRIPPL